MLTARDSDLAQLEHVKICDVLSTCFRPATDKQSEDMPHAAISTSRPCRIIKASYGLDFSAVWPSAGRRGGEVSIGMLVSPVSVSLNGESWAGVVLVPFADARSDFVAAKAPLHVVSV